MNSNSTERKKREITISRRWFIAGTLMGGTALTLAIVSQPSVIEFFGKKLTKMPMGERVVAEAKRNRHSAISIFRTALETVGVFFGNVGLGWVFDKVGVDHGGHAADGEFYEQQFEASPISVYVRDNVAMPVFEETMFRLLPSSLFAEDNKMHWGMGAASTALFAVIHNVSKPEEDKITLHFDSVPTEQIVLGLYCWYAQRTGGFLHAVGSHVLYNNICEAYWHFYEKKQFEKQPT